MRVLVTGADGQLGANLTRELGRQGHETRALIEQDRSALSLREVAAEIVRGDILDRSEIRAAISSCNAVIHAAAVIRNWPRRSPRLTRVNVEGTSNMIAESLREGIERFIYVGSAAAFRPGGSSSPGDEQTPYEARYRMAYLESKRAAQKAVLEATADRGLPAIVVNPTFMIGAYGGAACSSSLLIWLKQGRIPRYAPGGRNFVSAEDVAVATVNGLTQGTIGQCYILGHENLSYQAAFARMCAILCVAPPSKRAGPLMTMTAGLAQSAWAMISSQAPTLTYAVANLACEEWYYSSQKAIRDLGFPQTPLESSVRKAWAWFEQAGMV